MKYCKKLFELQLFPREMPSVTRDPVKSEEFQKTILVNKVELRGRTGIIDASACGLRRVGGEDGRTRVFEWRIPRTRRCGLNLKHSREEYVEIS